MHCMQVPGVAVQVYAATGRHRLDPTAGPCLGPFEGPKKVGGFLCARYFRT